MRTMDHNEAVRLHAAEKYLLGEFSQVQRDEYEEHYFTCMICAEDLKASAAFMDGARQVLRGQSFSETGAGAQAQRGTGWFAWLRPAFAVPVFAALLLFVGYQNAITIPGLKQASSPSAGVKVFEPHFLALGSRGADSPKFGLRPGEDLDLEIDLPPTDSPAGYIGQIQDEAGHVRTSFPVSAKQTKKTVHVRVPASALQAGKFALVILPGQEPGARAGEQKVVARAPFTVEFLP